MKKKLLLGTVIWLSTVGYSQNGVNNSKQLRKQFFTGPTRSMNDPINMTHTGGKKTVFTKNMSTCPGSGVPFTQAVNCFATGGGVITCNQNCLTYNPDLNTVFWTTRGSTEWKWTGNTSGSIQVTFLDLNTNKWDSAILYSDPGALIGGRYPGGVSLNQPGDTSVADAYMVGSGPYVATTFAGEWYASRALGGGEAALHTIPAADQNYAHLNAAPFGPVRSGYLNQDIQQVGSNMALVTGPLNDPAFTASGSNPIKGAIVAKAVLTGTAVVWTADTSSFLKPDLYKSALGYASTQSGRIAFGPDGQTGYAVFIGRVATNYNNNADSTLAPIVYKSTDAGTTWKYLSNLEGYDWPCKHPECEQGVGDYATYAMANGIYTNGSVNPRNYLFDESNGADLVVDVNNTLHFVCTLTPPGTNQIDSALYSYGVYYDYVNHHPIIWDFMCDGNSWKTLAVDSILSGACGLGGASDSTSGFSPFTDGTSNTNFLPYGAHITVSRSVDGKVVFYGWSDSDRDNVTTYNNQPDIMVKGYNVTTNQMTATTDISGQNGLSFFPYLSNLSYYDNVQQAYVVPAVAGYGTSLVSTGLYDGGKPMQFIYYSCGAFNAASFNQGANVNSDNPFSSCVLGIESHNAFESSISNYPNPFNNTTTIAVNLSGNKTVDVKIYNTIGNLVFSKKVNGTVGQNTVTFDGGQLSSGIYFYTVTAGNQQATKKMIIQK